MTRTTKATKTSTTTPSTPRLDALRADVIGGVPVGKDDVLAAMAEDLYLTPWRAQRDAVKRKAEAAERASWSDELARFIATVLAASEDHGFPLATVFTTDPEQIVKGNPAVLIEPASRVQHTGGGLAKGRVTLTLHNVTIDSKRLVGVLQQHSKSPVSYGNWPAVTLRSDGWVFDLPFVANPTAATFADLIKRDLEGMNVRVTPDGGTAYTRGAYATATIGQSEVVSKSQDSVTLRGHVLAQGRSTNPSSDAPYSHSEMVAVAKRTVENIAIAGGFVMGVGIVAGAQIVKTEPVEIEDGQMALGIQFEVTARGRYA